MKDEMIKKITHPFEKFNSIEPFYEPLVQRNLQNKTFLFNANAIKHK